MILNSTHTSPLSHLSHLIIFLNAYHLASLSTSLFSSIWIILFIVKPLTFKEPEIFNSNALFASQ